jgi:hypothetical protein
MTIGEAQAGHVPAAELHVLEPCGLGLGLSEFEEITREIDCDHLALGADDLRRRQRGGTAATAHIQHVRPATQPHSLDGSPAISRPEPQRLGVEVVCGGIVCCLGLELGRG